MAAKTRIGNWLTQCKISPSCWTKQDITSTLAHKTGTYEELCKGNGQKRQGFTFLQQKFPRVSLEKLKAGIFDGPQIRELNFRWRTECNWAVCLGFSQISYHKLSWEEPVWIIRKGSWWAPEKLSKIRGSHVSQNAPFTLILRLFPSKLRKLKGGTGRAFPPRYSCHGRTLTKAGGM